MQVEEPNIKDKKSFPKEFENPFYEIKEAKKRMWEYYKQSLTIENPNLLKEKLQKEYDPWPPFHTGD